MKRTVKNIVLILLMLTLGVSTALLAYLHFSEPDDRNLSGEWTAELDMTEQAAVTALGWLQEIEAVSISLEDMEAYMQNLTVQVNLTMEQTDRTGEASAAMYCRKATMPAGRLPMRDLPGLFKVFWLSGFAWQAIRAVQTGKL